MSSGDMLYSLTFGAPQDPVGYCGVQDPMESWVHQGLMEPCGHYRPCGALWVFHGPSLTIGPLVGPLEDRPAHLFPQGLSRNGLAGPLVNGQPGIV
jgi:hypothetical protein